MKKQNFVLIGVIILFLTLSIGYALFEENIEIKGTATAQGNFDVSVTAASVTTQVGSSGATAEISADGKTLTINVPKLEYPGAYVEIPIIVTNKGTIPAVLREIQETGLTADANVKISYTGLAEVKDQQLNQNETQNFIVKVMWDENSSASSENVEFSIKLNYKQIGA